MASTSQTEHALYMFTRTFESYKHESFLNLRTYSDGLPFANMISSIEYFVEIVDQLQANAQKWTQKLANLKKIVTRMESYVESEYKKILKINDLELVEIAKNNSQQEILKFFQVVIAVLMQTAQKQDYIQRIMALDERSQQALVIVVQNAMQQRISESQQNNVKLDSIEQLNSLQNQNHILTQQINQLCKQNEALLKKNNDLQQKMQECQQEIEKARNLSIEMYMNNSSKTSEIQRQTSLIQTLKKRMIQMARQHQTQLTKSNDEIYHLKGKLAHYREIEEELMERNKILQEKIKNYTLAVDDQRKRLEKVIDQKDAKLKKVEFELEVSRSKVRQLSEDIEVNDLNLRMELERKQVRFKQLQKEVKTRLIEPSIQISSKKTIINEQPMSPQKIEQNQEELQYLKSEVEKLRNSSRQLERENLKLKKKSQKVQAIQNQKKKLQKVILDVSKCRDSEIQMLVVSLYDLCNQNIKMHEIITQLKWREDSKYQ